MVIDLARQIEPIAPNIFRGIEAGYPIELYGNFYLVLKIEGCVKAPASDGGDDRKEARIILHRLTKSGAYSFTKSACCFTYVRLSGFVEDGFKPRLDLSRKRLHWVDEYNDIVRSGRNTSFIRHRYFDAYGMEKGIEGALAVEASKTWDGWY